MEDEKEDGSIVLNVSGHGRLGSVRRESLGFQDFQGFTTSGCLALPASHTARTPASSKERGVWTVRPIDFGKDPSSTC